MCSPFEKLTFQRETDLPPKPDLACLGAIGQAKCALITDFLIEARVGGVYTPRTREVQSERVFGLADAVRRREVWNIRPKEAMHYLVREFRRLGLRLEVVEFAVDSRYEIEGNDELKESGCEVLMEYAESEGWRVRTGGQERMIQEERARKAHEDAMELEWDRTRITPRDRGS